jgi:hypothetical protein
MFIGHFAPALIAATHKDAPRLPVLFIAAQLVDWAFFAFLLTGAEAMRIVPGFSAMNPMDLHHMPYTHSLLGALAFGGGTTVIVWFLAKGGGTTVVAWPRQVQEGGGTTVVIWARAVKAGLIAGAVVVSHWFLDWLVHMPDLTLAGSPPKLGLGLWDHPVIAIPLELALITGALWLYARRSGAKGLPLWTLAIVMALLQAINWFGPVEAEVTTGTSLLAFFAFGLITLAAYWAERSGLAGKQAER